MTKYGDFDYDQVKSKLEEMRREIANIIDWTCQHGELEVKIERRNLLESLWRAKDEVGHAAYIITHNVMDEEDD